MPNGYAFAAALALSAPTAAATPVQERIVSGDGILEANIAGVLGRIRIEPAGTAMSLLTNAYAELAGFKWGMFDFDYAVGTERVDDKTGVASIDLGSVPFRHRIGWTARPYTSGADGIIGPGGVPKNVVRLGSMHSCSRRTPRGVREDRSGGIASGWVNVTR